MNRDLTEKMEKIPFQGRAITRTKTLTEKPSWSTLKSKDSIRREQRAAASQLAMELARTQKEMWILCCLFRSYWRINS
jgi:hypothetical protein